MSIHTQLPFSHKSPCKFLILPHTTKPPVTQQLAFIKRFTRPATQHLTANHTCYGSVMKSKASDKAPLTKPLLKQLADRFKAKAKDLKNDLNQPSAVGSEPLKPAELDQDAGGGYNPDHTFPQA